MATVHGTKDLILAAKELVPQSGMECNYSDARKAHMLHWRLHSLFSLYYPVVVFTCINIIGFKLFI